MNKSFYIYELLYLINNELESIIKLYTAGFKNLEDKISFLDYYISLYSILELKIKDFRLFIEDHPKYIEKLEEILNSKNDKNYSLEEFFRLFESIAIKKNEILKISKKKLSSELEIIIKNKLKNIKKFYLLNKYFLKKLDLINKSINNIENKKILINKKVVKKVIKNKKYFEELLDFIIKNKEKNNSYKVINNSFAEVEIDKLLFVIRRESLFTNYLIIEDILDTEVNYDLLTREAYWNNEFIKFEENEELENYLINKKSNTLKNYLSLNLEDVVINFLTIK